MSSNSSDSGLIRLKESLPSDVAGKMITKNKNTETLKFRMEVINPNGSKTIDSLRQVELTIVPVDKEIRESNLSKKLKK
jgi:hypothetical protein